MPELPEVETVVRELRPRLQGRRIAAVRVGKRALRTPWSRAWEPQLIGRRFGEARRRGKWVVLPLADGLSEPRPLGSGQRPPHRSLTVAARKVPLSYLVIHLGMTGQLCVMPSDSPVAPHTHIVVDLDRGREQLRFRDVRRFGSATLFPTSEALDRFFVASRLGPEPFALDGAYWRACLAKTRRCLKAFLLDQRVVAGVGNIYADESLFEARLHPALLGRSLHPRQALALRKAVVTVLRRAIAKRGSSIRDYVGGSGLKGSYQEEFRVYGRAGDPCPRCGCLIERIELAGRSTHFCPGCQRA